MIGRKKEQAMLRDFYDSDKAEFVVVYGRRRVGKTYLIRETFDNNFFFYFTGQAGSEENPASTAIHLTRFKLALAEYGSAINKEISSWDEAFTCLKELIMASQTKRKLIFIDELPWLDLPKSGFLSALEYFWNSFASARKDIMFVVCGSAAAWITRKLFENKGGLHNRTTGRIYLKPFDLSECEEFLQAKGCTYARYDVVECYMVFGGIPYYLDYINDKYSIAVNVDNIVFAEAAPLRNEYKELYYSLFTNPEAYMEIVAALSKKSMGLTREEIIAHTTFTNGGNLSEVLSALELSGFIRMYQAYPNKKRGALYQLIDNFTLFWFTFIQTKRPTNPRYWSMSRATPGLNAWRGYAFEMVCLKHVDQIEQGLGISGVLTQVSTWKSTESSPGAQIDLIIDREDRVINVCEIKYSQTEYEISAEYARNLRNKLAVFQKETGTKRTLFLTMITTYGIKHGVNSGMVRAEIDMDALFLPGRFL